MTHLPTSTTLSLSPSARRQADICVRCGFCLPACPTYAETGNEADSPRGRIAIMQAMAEGRVEPTATARKHLDLCLDCRACETACPSGVVYHELIEEARAELRVMPEAAPRRPRTGRLTNFMIYRVMPHPRRMKGLLLPARLLQKARLFKPVSRLAGRIFGTGIDKMRRMLPEDGPLWESDLARRHPARGEAKMTVGLLAGCVGSVLDQPTNRKTIELLQHLGCDVLVPREQRCCGAIHHHGGLPDPAADFAKRNIDAFADCDRIVNNIAGCGAMLKEYGPLLRDAPDWAARATAFTERVRDINELLVELDPPPPPRRVDRNATYHDACHLAHGQGVTAAPRKLLGMIDGLQLVPLVESDMCCGAAGAYNLQQPEMSADLAARKLRHIADTGADLCVSSNIGCTMQIRSEAATRGVKLRVVHPVDLLHEAYGL